MTRTARHFSWKYTLRPQAGFTLIELLTTMVILTVGLLGSAALTTGIIRGNHFSKNIGSATAIAESQLEAVQREGYANVTTTKFSPSAQTVSMGGVNFSRTTTIADAAPAANMKTIIVVVSWSEASNVDRKVTLQTIVAQ
jgi:prepilin-type N-terminal cleavage/methylation domain-containing protein